MENKFLEGMAEDTNWKKTENGADALASTRDDLVDLFGTIGSLRTRSDSDIEQKFMKAYYADKLLGLKMLFYARNIRGGLGERNVFRVVLKWMATRDPQNILANFSNIATFGRWDDFYSFVDTPLEDKAFAFMKDQFEEDLCHLKDNKTVSLLGKWLKSANSHNKKTRELGLKTAAAFDLNEADYRKALSALRKAINVTEVSMSKNDWAGIKYPQVPSKAMNNYHNAFMKHDNERFNEFLGKVVKGEVKINSSTLYPYDLVEKYIGCGCGWGRYSALDATIEAQWNALPNYVKGDNNFMVMADTSGSMTGRPICTSVGLAIYFAQHNHGPYHNKFMIFSADPYFIDLKGKTLKDCLAEIDWGVCYQNTDIEKAFDKILQVAVSNHLEQKDLPKSLIIISDMEFDEASGSSSGYGYGYNKPRQDYTTLMKAKYAAAGYELPTIVYWNADARQDTFHAKATAPGVQFISGQSASAFESLIKGAEYTAYDLMLETLNNPIYNNVHLATALTKESE